MNMASTNLVASYEGIVTTQKESSALKKAPVTVHMKSAGGEKAGDGTLLSLVYYAKSI